MIEVIWKTTYNSQYVWSCNGTAYLRSRGQWHEARVPLEIEDVVDPQLVVHHAQEHADYLVRLLVLAVPGYPPFSGKHSFLLPWCPRTPPNLLIYT